MARRTKVVDGPFDVGETIEVVIESLTNLGDGVARYESANETKSGMVVLVPYVIPGERIKCRVWRNLKQHALADLVEVLDESPDRAQPACALFGTCLGCQYQHMTVETQRSWKRNHVTDVLAKLAGAAVDVEPVVGGDRVYGYRSKLTPHYDKPSNGVVGPIGFMTARRRLVDVERCEIATDKINARLATLRDEARAKPSGKKGATLLLRDHAQGVSTDPNEIVGESVRGLDFRFKAGDFWQNNPDALPLLVEHVVHEAKGARFLVDCYCGGGLFALNSAANFEEVFGLELSETNIRAARENALRNHITNAQFEAGKAEDLFAGVLHLPANATAVILDPPRKGASEDFLRQLVAFGPATIVYVSCDPATQARDAAILLEAGYAISRATPFDLFPQTRHIESVLTFVPRSERRESH